MTRGDGTEGVTAAQWLVSTLSGDAALLALLDNDLKRITDSPLPDDGAPRRSDGTPAPWITFTIMEPRDVRVVGMIPVYSEVMVQVKVSVAATTYAPAVPVYRRVHALLDQQTNRLTDGAMATGLVLTSYRASGVQYPERAQGVEYRHLGGVYVLAVQ